MDDESLQVQTTFASRDFLNDSAKVRMIELIDLDEGEEIVVSFENDQFRFRVLEFTYALVPMCYVQLLQSDRIWPAQGFTIDSTGQLTWYLQTLARWNLASAPLSTHRYHERYYNAEAQYAYQSSTEIPADVPPMPLTHPQMFSGF